MLFKDRFTTPRSEILNYKILFLGLSLTKLVCILQIVDAIDTMILLTSFLARNMMYVQLTWIIRQVAKKIGRLVLLVTLINKIIDLKESVEQKLTNEEELEE